MSSRGTAALLGLTLAGCGLAHERATDASVDAAVGQLTILDLVVQVDAAHHVPEPSERVHARWRVTFEGVSGDVAVLSQAQLRFSDALVQDLSVDVTVVPLIDGSATAVEMSVGSHPAATDLEAICAVGSAELTLAFVAGGRTFSSRATDSFLCAL